MVAFSALPILLLMLISKFQNCMLSLTNRATPLPWPVDQSFLIILYPGIVILCLGFRKVLLMDDYQFFSCLM